LIHKVVGLFCALLLAGAASAQPASTSSGQAWPSKPVRIIVATSPGGPYDETARAVGPKLTEIWGQTVIVDNRPGAANIIGATLAAKSPPDGYTYFLGSVASTAINPSLRKSLPYEPQRDFVPVSLMLSSPMILIVHPSMPVKSVKELVALARAKPGGLNYASAGVGNFQHLSMELLMSMAKIKMNHVPYKGFAPAIVDLTTGQVTLMFANIAGAMPHIRNQRVRAVAVSSAQGSALLPSIPAVATIYPDFDLTTWMGLLAPTGTPREIVTKVGGDMNRVLKHPDLQQRFAGLGQEVLAGSPEQLTEYMRRDRARFAALIKDIGLTPD
jgi:tripartite-type tricarboxylate transporter receptor subunit TctC